MTTSVYNQRRRNKLRAEKRAWKRRERHTGGDWKYRSTCLARPNAQNGRDQRGKDKK